MEQEWWQTLIMLLGAVGGFEFIKWLFNRRTEKRLNDLEVRQKDFDLDERRIVELHESIDKANALNDRLLERISKANAAVDKYVDRNRTLSDRLFESEQETNRVNASLHDANNKIAELTAANGKLRLESEHYKQWHCRKGDCHERIPPNPNLNGKIYKKPDIGKN